MPLLLTVGRNHPKKGYELIPRMGRALRARGLDSVWLVVGKGADKLTESGHCSGLEDRVLTLEEIGPPVAPDGGPPQLPARELVEMFAAADILVHPSYIEGFPRVLAEGMAAGCAVGTTDASGCRDVVTDGTTGCVAPAGDADALGRAVATLIADKDLRDRVAGAAQEHARQFDWGRVVEQYEDLYYRSLNSYTAGRGSRGDVRP